MLILLHFLVIDARKDVANVYEQRVDEEIDCFSAVALFHQLLLINNLREAMAGSNNKSQKIRHQFAVMYTLDAARVLSEELKRKLSFPVDPHQARFVPTTVTVVWSRPDAHQTPLPEPPLVPLLHQLVRTDDQLQPVVVVELFGHSPSEQPTHPSAA